MVQRLRDNDYVQKHKQQSLRKALKNIQRLCNILSTKMPSSVIILKAA